MCAAAALSAIVSCARLSLPNEPSIVRETTMDGYPDIQATIDASLDNALAAVNAAAARVADTDPRYLTLIRELQRGKGGERLSKPASSPESSDELSEDEQRELDKLIAANPALKAAFARLADELEAAYAGIGTIEVKAQPLDKNESPVRESYTIRSRDGVIDLGYQALTTHEYLLRLQSQAFRAERGFVIDTDYYGQGFHPDYAAGRPWPGRIVKYFFDSTISDDADKRWMRNLLHRTWHATGIAFLEYENSDRRRSDWLRRRGGYLRISRAQLGRTPGWASVGKVGSSFLEMDVDLARTDENKGHFYHEVGHVLGLLHEHQRYDRDTYVYVDRNGPSYNRLNYDRIPQWRNEKHCFLWVFC